MLPAASLSALVLVTCALILATVRLRREVAGLSAAASALAGLADVVGAVRAEAERAGAARRATLASGPTRADR
ncbi:MAG: hypothetical protein R2726_09535 [Acidimicrobiales bacterium]